MPPKVVNSKPSVKAGDIVLSKRKRKAKSDSGDAYEEESEDE